MTWEEACRALGVAPIATAKEVHEQYLYKVQLLHPDGNSNKPAAVRKKAEEELKAVNEAYGVLKDPANNPFANSPRIHVSSRKLRFRDVDFGERRSATFEVSSAGGAFGKVWLDDAPAPWLKVTEIRSLGSELLPLEAQIEASGILEPNERASCDLKIRIENIQTGAVDEAIVTIEIWMKAAPGTLKVLPAKPARFKGVKPGATRTCQVEIANTGRGWLRGHLFTTRPWLSVSPDLVNLEPRTRTKYTISLATRGLRRGLTDKGFVNILTNGGDERIAVDLTTASSPLKPIGSFLKVVGWCLLALGPPAAAVSFLQPEPWKQPVLWWAVGGYVLLIAAFSKLVRLGKAR